MSKQHCRLLQVERFFRQCQMLLRHCCHFWQQCCRFRQQCPTKFRPFDKVETNWTCSICFDFVERTKLYNRIVRHCCCLWQQSRMLLRQSQTLLRHCCWCGWGITHIMFCCTQTWTLSVINWRPTSVNSLSHSASTGVDNICDGRRAEAKFSKSRVGDKVPDGNTLIFGDTRIPCRGKPLWQSEHYPFSHFDTILVCDRWTYTGS